MCLINSIRNIFNLEEHLSKISILKYKGFIGKISYERLVYESADHMSLVISQKLSEKKKSCSIGPKNVLKTQCWK